MHDHVLAILGLVEHNAHVVDVHAAGLGPEGQVAGLGLVPTQGGGGNAINYPPETIDDIAANNSGEEVIFAVNGGSGTRTRAGITIQSPKLVTLMTYTDVMLSYAECMYRMGDMQSAERYLNAVARAKGVSFSGDNMLAKIADARRRLMLYSFGNFAFFKRSGLATAEYGVEDYRLLWPIPLSELHSNPNMTQNPGY